MHPLVDLTGARNNVQNGTSFLEVQDGVLEGVGRIVTRMSELKGPWITGSDEEFTGY